MVVDNTNVDAVSRKRYIDVAKRLHAPVRAFLMDVTLEHAMHNELVRPTIQKRERERRGDCVLDTFIKQFARCSQTTVLQLSSDFTTI